MIDPLAEHWEASDHALVRRVKASQVTRDEWAERPWRMGQADCVRMTASHLRRMGYSVKLPPEGSYRTVKSAQKKLQEKGFTSLADAMDQLGFPRIAPAAALVGDIVEMPSEIDQLGTLVVALGNGRVLGWHEDAPAGACVLQPVDWIAAWRIDPLEPIA